MKILCIIPARSGSKSLPHKNIRDFNGKPMIWWSIEQAKKCRFIDDMRIIVSTDSEEYSKIAKDAGAEVPFLRPPEISEDLSTDLECFQHALQYLKKVENYSPDILLHLRPTYPTRSVKDIDICIEVFINQTKNGYTSLRTVVPIEKSPFKMYTISYTVLEPLFTQVSGILEPYNMPRQILPQAFLHNGCIDVVLTKTVLEGSVTGSKIYPYVMNESEVKDIDTEKDFQEALEEK
jgi:CMP-N,N'-diacetyllegionaminic acid synthase